MGYEMIALLMFASMMLMLITGQRVFAAIGSVAALAALVLWGDGGSEMAFSAAMKLMKWYPLLTLPMFIYMGFMLSESGIADDLYRMFHVWFGPVRGGLAIGTIGLMVFLMRAMAPPEIALGDIYRSIIPFVLVMVVALTLVMVFPQLALWLPEQHYGR